MAKELDFEEDVRILILDTSVETNNGDYVIYEEKFEELRKGILELVGNWLPTKEEIAIPAIRKLIMDKFGLKEVKV